MVLGRITAVGTDPTVLPFLMFGTGAEVFKKTAAELMGGEKAKQSIHRTSPDRERKHQ